MISSNQTPCCVQGQKEDKHVHKGTKMADIKSVEYVVDERTQNKDIVPGRDLTG